MSESESSQPVDPLALVSKLKSRGPAPVHLWDPPFCGDIDMCIQRDGTWLHEGKPIRRKAMVQLFASILMLDKDRQYYLVTPAEKVRIKVEDCPFTVVLMDVKGAGQAQQIRFTTNTEEVFTLDKAHVLFVREDAASHEPHPVVHVRSGLNALLTRNVFYQLVDLGVYRELESVRLFGVWSAGTFFALSGPVTD